MDIPSDDNFNVPLDDNNIERLKEVREYEKDRILIEESLLSILGKSGFQTEIVDELIMMRMPDQENSLGLTCAEIFGGMSYQELTEPQSTNFQAVRSLARYVFDISDAAESKGTDHEVDPDSKAWLQYSLQHDQILGIDLRRVLYAMSRGLMPGNDLPTDPEEIRKIVDKRNIEPFEFDIKKENRAKARTLIAKTALFSDNLDFAERGFLNMALEFERGGELSSAQHFYDMVRRKLIENASIEPQVVDAKLEELRKSFLGDLEL